MIDAAAAAPAADPAEVDPAASAARKAARRIWLQWLVVGLAVVGPAWGGWFYLFARNFVNTDNACVNAQMAQITPPAQGPAIEVLLVIETQQVKAGDVPVRLDQADARIAVAQAEADLAAARRRLLKSPYSQRGLARLRRRCRDSAPNFRSCCGPAESGPHADCRSPCR